MIQPESGLLVVTVMGIFLANQKLVMINHIVTFKENISVLLISSLFILLAARIDLASFQAALQLKSILFIMSLIFIIRPLSIFLSTIGSSLAIQEKFFLSFMYPRGIVAAAISSIFSIRLSAFGVQDAEQIIPLTFIAIVFTVTFYGLIGKFLVSLLGLNRRQKGLFIVGAHKWARTFAKILRDNKITVILVDTNLENILLARKENLDCIHGSILSKRIMDDIEISGFGKLLALTSSDETNLLSTIEYKEIFGSKNVFMLSPKDKKKDIFENSNSGKLAFNKGVTFTYIDSLLIAGATFQLTEITEQLSFEEFLTKTPRAIHLCYLSETTRIHIFSDDHTLKPKIGSTVISIIPN